MEQQEIKAKELLNAFIKSFEKQISQSKQENLKKLDIVSERKYFFKYDLLPNIADELKLTYKKDEEFLRVDYTLFKEGSQCEWKVPQIVIESENNWESCYEEVLKLLSINTLLKVLVLYGLNEDQKNEIDNNDGHWDYILKDYIEDLGVTGYFIVLVYVGQSTANINFVKKIYYKNNNSEVFKETSELNIPRVNS